MKFFNFFWVLSIISITLGVSSSFVSLGISLWNWNADEKNLQKIFIAGLLLVMSKMSIK